MTGSYLAFSLCGVEPGIRRAAPGLVTFAVLEPCIDRIDCPKCGFVKQLLKLLIVQLWMMRPCTPEINPNIITLHCVLLHLFTYVI